MTELLSTVPADEKDNVSQLLENLGRKIGREWAKDNRIRRIDSTMLRDWGNALRKAGRKGHESLIAKIRSLDSDADKIF